MCVCSFLGQILYGSIMVVALGLTLVSMLTPGWQQVKEMDVDKAHDVKDVGILFCRNPGQGATTDSPDGNYCEVWWNNQPPKMKAVIACMVLAILVEVAAIVWTILSICACCCKSCLVQPLPLFAFVGALLLAIAVGIYGVNHQDSIIPPKDAQHAMEGSVSYSFYLACGGLAACIADIVVGTLTVTLASSCL
uniref:LHFPL tetraspan subfamily member 4b n=1 Tax=Steinernema glaseri TaxID=37863 RepID=A0A1I8ABR4_9BILA